jgi:hypothetical protein
LAGMELEWRLRRERVDLMNHRFWVSAALRRQFALQDAEHEVIYLVSRKSLQILPFSFERPSRLLARYI